MATVLERVQKNPNILTKDKEWLAEAATNLQWVIAGLCHLPIFPEVAAGYSESNGSPSENISGLAKNGFRLSANGETATTVELTLAGLTSSGAIVTELNTVIQALESVDDTYAEVVASFTSDGRYRITSGRFGIESSIHVSWDEGSPHIPRALKLSPAFGGVEYHGAADNEELLALVIEMIEDRYRQMDLERSSDTIPASGTKFEASDFSERQMNVIRNNRKMS